MELACANGVWGTRSWTTGFRVPRAVVREAGFRGEVDFYLREAEIAESEGRKEAAEHWLNEAIAAEASAKSGTRTAA